MKSEVKLGKHKAVMDERTPNMSLFFAPTIVKPDPYDFDKGRSRFPLQPWGNLDWGNCVKVAQANGIVRLERIEQRRTIPMTEDDVVGAYMAQSGALSPGDSRDNGLVALANQRLWRTNGFDVKSEAKKPTTRNYTIAAFGELDPTDFDQFKSGSYLLHGVQMGFWLPLAAKKMYRAGQTWDYRGETGPEWKAGSWGGHMVFSKMYDDNHAEILTWGEKVIVTANFIKKFCDEQYVVVDRFDVWRKRPEFDVEALIAHLHNIGASNIER